MKNKLIVLYGVNNLGKTTQANRLVDHLKGKNIPVTYIKYPIYENRSGQLINDYLRGQSHLTVEDFNILQVINKYEFADKLDELLTNSWVVSEDYTLTGTAWGMAQGLQRKWFERLYEPLRKPDLEVLIDGERFTDATEKTHKFETDQKLINRARQIHLDLAKDYKIPIINANQPIKRVSNDIVNLIEALSSSRKLLQT